MAWIKVPAAHRPAFEAALPRDPRVKTMQMFGGIAASVNGNMFGGLFGLSAIVRLSGEDHAEALALEGASRFDPMGNGRVSESTVMLPEAVFHDEEQLSHWLRRAFDGAAKLPPKVKHGKRGAKAAKPTAGRKPAAAKRTTNAPAKRPAKAKHRARRRPDARSPASAKMTRR
jgi:TfoX/Sxy family transcriptional regulator of competence genes